MLSCITAPKHRVGFHCCIAGTTVYFLLNRPNVGRRPQDPKLVSFVFIIWAVATINLATGIQWNMMMFINDRNYPGGPPGFLLGEYSLPINTLSNTSYVIDNCLTDLMVVRFTMFSLHLRSVG